MLSDRVRSFSHEGRRYAHASAVPLAYLSGSAPLMDALQRFTTPTRPVDAWPDATRADADFLALLVRSGLLVDAKRPDPVHSFRGREDASRQLMLYPTNSCNLRCVYCYATSGPGAGPRLSREHALMAVEDFFATLGDGVEQVRLGFHGGGEPTTNFPVMTAAWERFRALADEQGLASSVSTITNGTFGAQVLRTLSQPEWRLVISYDGPRQGAQRPTAADTDSRDRVVANLRALAAAGKPLHTRATLTRDGLPSMRALVDDAAEIGIRGVQVEPSSLVGRGADLTDGPPDPLEFAEAFLDAFRYGLEQGVRLTTSGWTTARVGDGRYCGAISGLRAVTPDGFVSACTEACDGGTPDDPFIVGRLDTAGRRLEIWPIRESALQARTGYHLPHCSTCAMVDTCAGGCASSARAESGDAFSRDVAHCAISRRVNPELMADLAEGRLLPDDGWQPFDARLDEGASSVAGASGRLVALVPPFARRQWNADPARRPFILTPTAADPFFHLPAQ